jgi:hypothetical protein
MAKGFGFSSFVSIWDAHKNERVKIGVRTCRDLSIVCIYGPCGVENYIVVLVEIVHEDCEQWKLFLSQPHFEKSVRMRFTLPKWELGSPLGLPKLQSSITGVKTPRIEMLFISLESYQNVDVKNGLA